MSATPSLNTVYYIIGVGDMKQVHQKWYETGLQKTEQCKEIQILQYTAFVRVIFSLLKLRISLWHQFFFKKKKRFKSSSL